MISGSVKEAVTLGSGCGSSKTKLFAPKDLSDGDVVVFIGCGAGRIADPAKLKDVRIVTEKGLVTVDGKVTADRNAVIGDYRKLAKGSTVSFTV